MQESLPDFDPPETLSYAILAVRLALIIAPSSSFSCCPHFSSLFSADLQSIEVQLTLGDGPNQRRRKKFHSSPFFSNSSVYFTAFDMVSFYGPLTLQCTFTQDNLITKSVPTVFSITLQEVLRAQYENTESYWGYRKRIHVPRMSSSPSSIESFDLETRYIRINDCISVNEGSTLSELQMVARFDYKIILSYLLKTIARFQLLRQALYLRSLSPCSSDSSVCENLPQNAFECALANGSESCCRLLLQSCGSLCFQNTLPLSSTALHFAVIGNSFSCLKTTLLFLRRFGTSDVIGWDGTFQDYIAWHDSKGYTPLHCKLLFVLYTVLS